VAVKKNTPEQDLPKSPPAKTPQARENQLIALAYDEAEKQIRAGNATSQLLTHFLKLGTMREGVERMKLEQEVILLQAKSQQIANQEKTEEQYAKALAAMSMYQGNDMPPEHDDR
jgi:hypothetical protein